MLFALGAASSAWDAITSSLTSSNTQPAQSAGSNTFDPFSITGSAALAPSSTTNNSSSGSSLPPVLSPATLSTLFAVQSQASTATTGSALTSQPAALQDLFSQIDANGDGQISQAEFENALGAGGTNLTQANNVFSQLDTNGNGLVSPAELSSALQGAGGKGGHHHHFGHGGGLSSFGNSSSSGGSSSDPLLQASAGATTSTVTNSDGSTTTSITNPDGTKITLTTPASSTSTSSGTSSNSATDSYNRLEQLIQREAEVISSGATQPFSLNA